MLDMMDDTMGIVCEAETHHWHMLSTTEKSVYEITKHTELD